MNAARRFRRTITYIIGIKQPETTFYIPANRSLFTSAGLAVSAFNHFGFLDPITQSFGSFFTTWIGYGSRNRDDLSPILKRFMERSIGGKISHSKKGSQISTKDGRMLKLSQLSSGQQEILPLIYSFDYLTDFDELPFLAVVEEPESHLFPNTQAQIVDLLTRILSTHKAKSGFVITTHSPYVLAKFNNLIKAASISRSSEGAKDKLLKNIIGHNEYTSAINTSAYAILDGNVVDIFDYDEGLISADYIDEISTNIFDEFNSLLEVEYDKI